MPTRVQTGDLARTSEPSRARNLVGTLAESWDRTTLEGDMRLSIIGSLIGGTGAAVCTYVGLRVACASAIKHGDVFESDVLLGFLVGAGPLGLLGACFGWLVGRAGDWLFTKPQ